MRSGGVPPRTLLLLLHSIVSARSQDALQPTAAAAVGRAPSWPPLPCRLSVAVPLWYDLIVVYFGFDENHKSDSRTMACMEKRKNLCVPIGAD